MNRISIIKVLKVSGYYEKYLKHYTGVEMPLIRTTNPKRSHWYPHVIKIIRDAKDMELDLEFYISAQIKLLTSFRIFPYANLLHGRKARQRLITNYDVEIDIIVPVDIQFGKCFDGIEIGMTYGLDPIQSVYRISTVLPLEFLACCKHTLEQFPQLMDRFNENYDAICQKIKIGGEYSAFEQERKRRCLRPL